VRNLVHVLGKIADEAAFGPVVTLLGHPHARVRIEAVRALALIAPARAAAPLVAVSRDADPEVRLEAVHALGALRCEEAATVLRDVAAGATGNLMDAPLRREAIDALAAIGSPDAREALVSLARRRLWPWQRVERGLRQAAAAALATRPDAEEPANE
jgi:HEAT repeat protein